MREFKINREQAIEAVTGFLDGLAAYEASEEFSGVMRKHEEFLATRREAIKEEEQLALKLHRLEKAVATAGFFQRGNAAMELAMFKARHPYLHQVIDLYGHYTPPDEPWSPRDYLQKERDPALRIGDLLRMLAGDEVLLETELVHTLAEYASGRRLQFIKDRAEGRA